MGDPEQILTGQYQLQIRPSESFGAVDDAGRLSLFQTFNVNDRLSQGITLVARAGSTIVDGQSFTVDDGDQVLRFEFNLSGGQTIANSILINVSASDTAAAVATKIRDAINNAVISQSFKVRAATLPGGNRVDLFDALSVSGQGLQNVLVFDSVGDRRPTARAAGQIIIQNSTVSHSRQVGIQVIPDTRQIEETAVAFTTQGQFPIGVPGRTGSITHVPNNNTKGWVPGITIKNNLITHSGRTGIMVGGDPNASYAYAQGLAELGWPGIDGASFSRAIELFVPFVRILNNTVYDAKVGIAAVNVAGPTIMNNVVANVRINTNNVIRFQGAAIYVDPSSGQPKGLPGGLVSLFGESVVAANLYQSNSLNSAGVAETLAINLGPSDPLFVDAANDNFYLNALSKAIDSSVDSLIDRPELVSVLGPLGFSQSPILAPEKDLLGQTRVDDPAVDPPAGVGGNVFKDRGALERADFIGPTAVLLNPVDNDASGADRNQLPHQVQLVNALLTDFGIQLLDSGAGINNATVDVNKFVVQRTVDGVTTTLVPNLDYILAYDTNSRVARLVPSQGLWINGIYTITLDRSVATGIEDLAGNTLQENAPPQTRFIIELTDTIVSPWQNPTNRFDVDNDGRVNGRDLLWLINKILVGESGPLPLVAEAPPYLDVTGDGALRTSDVLAVVNEILRNQAQPSAAVADPLVAAEESSSGEVPSAEPRLETNTVAAGLVMSQSSSQPTEEPAVQVEEIDTQEVTSPAAPQAVALAMADETPVDELDGLDAWDEDLDSILGDLSGDLQKRSWV